MSKGLRKIITILVAVLYLLSIMVTVYATPSDIRGRSDQSILDKWVNYGLVTLQPDGSLKPDEVIKRIELYSYINKIFKYTEKSTATFTDVVAGSWYSDDIAKGVVAGYIKADKSNKVYPFTSLNRLELCSVLARVFQLTASNPYIIEQYSDSSKIPDEYRNAVSAMVEKGYIGALSGDKFAPFNTVTRAQAIVIINNVMGELVNSGATYSSTVRGNLVVTMKNITIRNTVVSGNLYITEGVGDSNVTLENVTVKGKAFINGGGENSIKFKNSTVEGEMSICKKDGKVRVTAEGTSSIPSVKANSGVKLEEIGTPAKGFEKVDVTGTTGANMPVALKGNFTDIGVTTDNAGLQVEGNVSNIDIKKTADDTSLKYISGTLNQLNVQSDRSIISLNGGTVNSINLQNTSEASRVIVQGASVGTISISAPSKLDIVSGVVTNLNTGTGSAGTVVQLETTAQISSLNAGDGLDINGQGIIAVANINSQNVSIERRPAIVNLGAGITADIGGTSSVSMPTISVSASSLSVMQGSTAPSIVTVNPPAATLRFSSANSGIASVDSTTGVITGVSVGTTTINVAASSSGYFSSGTSFAVTVTPPTVTISGSLNVSPGNADEKAIDDIVLAYTPGEALKNGTVEFTLPAEFTANTNDTIQIGSSAVNKLTAGQISGQKVTITGVNTSAGQTIVLTLVQKTMPVEKSASKALSFTAKADVDGSGSRTMSTGTGNETKTFTVNDKTPPELVSAAIDGTHKVITLTFDGNIASSFANDTDLSALKAAITISVAGGSPQLLGTNDAISINNKTLVITFNSVLISNDNVISIDAGALEDAAGNATTLDTDTNSIDASADIVAPAILSAVRDDDTHITVTLSEDVNTSTITKSNNGGFAVCDTNTPAATYTVTAIAPGTTNDKVVLTVANMGASQTHGVTVKYTSGGNGTVADSAGNVMVSDNTGVNIAVWDSTAPIILSAVRNSDTQVTVTLSEVVNASTIIKSDDGGFTVCDTSVPANTYTVTAIAPGATNDKVVLTVANMSGAQIHGVTVKYTAGGNGTVADTSGNILATNNTGVTIAVWDSTPPTIQSVTRNSDTQITVTLSEVVNASTITKANNGGFTVFDTSNSATTYAVTAIAPGTTSNKVVLAVANMSASQTNGVTVKYTAGGNGTVTDAAGNIMADNAGVNIPVWDSTGPIIQSAVRNSNTQITVTLSELANHASITKNNSGGFIVFRTGDPTATYAVTAIAAGAADDTVVLTVANMASAGSAGVTVRYASGGNGTVADATGNLMTTDNTGVAIAGWETTPPNISGAVRNSNTRITVTLSELADQASITKANNGGFTVYKADNAAITYTVIDISPGATNDTVVLNVSNMGSAGAVGVKVKYTAGGNGTVADIAGNAMATDNAGVTINAWDNSAPILSSAVRNSNIQITVTLSEPLDASTISKFNNGGFTVCDANTPAITYAVSVIAQGDTSSKIVLTVADISASQSNGVIVKYTAGGNGTVADLAGNTLVTDNTGVNVAAWDSTPITMISAVRDNNTQITVSLSEYANASTITKLNNGGFTVCDTNTPSTTYAITAINPGTTPDKVVLTVANMNASQNNGVTVKYLAGGIGTVADNSGNAMVTNNTGVTVIPWDSTPPTIQSATRDSNTQITVTLSEAANSSTVTKLNNGGFTVCDTATSTTTYAITRIDPGATPDKIILTIADMSASQTNGVKVKYTAGGNGTVADAAGNLLATNNTGLTTGPWDSTPPTIQSAIRNSNTQITVTLSEVVNPTTITKGNDGGFVVCDTNTPATTYAVTAIAPGTTNDKVVLTVANMSASQTHGVTVKYTAGGNGTVADASGNSMVTNNAGVTLPVWDSTPPTIQSATRNSNTQITVTLSEVVTASTITKGNSGGFVVCDTNTPTTTYAVTAIAPGTTNDKVVLTVANMSASQTHGVTVKYTAGGNGTVADAASNAMVTDNTGVTLPVWDSTPPTIQSAARNSNTQITVTLSEALDPLTVSKGNNGGFVVCDKNTPAITYSISAITAGATPDKVVLTVADMSVSQTNGVIVKYTAGGNGTVTDAAGNLLATNNTGVNIGVWDSVPPTIQSAVRNSNTQITVTLNEALDPNTVTKGNDGGFVVCDKNTPATTYAVAAIAPGTTPDKVVLTVADMIGSQANGVTVTYTAGGNGTVTDTSNNLLATNSTGVNINAWDSTPPTIQSAARNSNTQITVTLSEVANASTITKANNGGFTVCDTNTPTTTYAVTAIAPGTTNDKVVLTVANMSASQINGVTVKYTAGGNGTVADPSGNALATNSTGVTVSPWDTTAPAYVSATVDATHKIVTLTFTENIVNATTDIAALKNAITFASNGTSFSGLGNNDNISISGKDLVITFNNVLTTATNKIKVNANALADLSGNVLSSIVTAGPVDASADIVPPSLATGGAVIDSANPDKIVLTFNEALGTATSPTTAQFVVDINNGTPGIINSISINASGKTITITLSAPVANNDDISVTYTPATGKEIKDTAGNATLTFTQKVTNNVAAAAVVTQVSATNLYGSSFSQGQNIYITVTFNSSVTVIGTPVLLLETGSTDRNATYISGSGTNTLLFLYTVQPGDTSSALNYASTGALSLGTGGSIKNTGTQIDSTLTLPALNAITSLAGGKNLKIDTQPPQTVTVTAVDIDSTKATLTVTSDKSGKAYYVVLLSTLPAPNTTQVKLGTDSWDTPLQVNMRGTVNLSANQPIDTIIYGLQASTSNKTYSYKIYVVVEDSLGNARSVVDASGAFSTSTAADKTPPSYVGSITHSETNNTATVQLKINKGGRAYYIVLPANSAAPDVDEVRDGTDANDTTLAANRKGSITLAANTTGIITISGLTASASYDIYIVVENLNVPPDPETTASLTPIQVTTKAAPDSTAPTNTSTPSLYGITATTANISVMIDEDGKTYYVVLAQNSAAPSSAQVKAGTNAAGAAPVTKGSISITANTPSTLSITGLTKATAYDIYVVSEDSLGNIQTSPVRLNITTDSTTDTFAPNTIPSYPRVNAGDTTATISMKTDEPGKVYYVILNSGAAAPNSSQVKQGKDGANGNAVKSGNAALTANTDSVISVTGLLVSTAYDIYIVAEDAATTPNLQQTPVKLSIVTTPVDLTGVTVDVAAGKIIGTKATMQYSFDATNGTTGNWSACVDGTTSSVPFTTGDLYIREKLNPANYRLVANIKAASTPTVADMAAIDFDVAAGTITGTKNNMEYSIAGGAWLPVTAGGTTSNLTFLPGIVNIRYKATQSHMASSALPIGYTLSNTVGDSVIASPPAPTLAYDDVLDTITVLDTDPTYEYKISTATSWTPAGTGIVYFHGAKTIYVRLKATATTLAGQQQTITFTANLDMSGVGISISAAQLYGTTSSMQYSIDSTDGLNGTWSNCSTTSSTTDIINMNNAVNVYIRDKNQHANFRKMAASAAAPVGVSATGPLSTKVLSGATTAMEYSRDGGVTWYPVSSLLVDGSDSIDVSTAPNNDLRLRAKATSTKLASLPTASLTPVIDLSTVGINVGNYTLTGTTNQLEYSLDSNDGLSNGNWTRCTSPVTTNIPFVAGKVYVRVAAQPRNIRLFTIAAQNVAPGAKLVPTATIVSRTKITTLDSTKTYQYVVDNNPTIAANSVAWGSAIVVSGTDYIDNIVAATGSYIHIREKGTAGAFPSLIKDLAVQVTDLRPAAAPQLTVSSVTGTTQISWQSSGTVVTAADGLEYSLDGSAWIDVPDNLTVNLAGDHILYVRKKATTSLPASDITPDLDTSAS